MESPEKPSFTLHERLLECQNTAILLLDSDLTPHYLNPAAEALLSTSAQNAYRHGLSIWLNSNPRLMAALKEALQTGQGATLRESALVMPHGETTGTDCSITPIEDDELGIFLLLEIADIDRHLRIAREDQLISLHQTTRQFVRGLAHEVKNPLGGLRGAAQLLDRELTDPAQREYTRIILHETDRLRTLVDRMLGPNTLPHKGWENIHEPLEYVRQLLRVECVESAIRIRCDYDPSIPELCIDTDQIIQAVLNIARNAVQVLEKVPEPRLLFRTRVLRQFTLGHTVHKLVARVDIEDNGPGIPEKLQESVFFPMVSGRPEGTGLGLSIAQTLIAQHGGLIEFQSRPGRTVFTLLLPISTATESPS
ncbi:MAG: nitrogen regulation protein NR(II) [Halothiobacillaceae bacterium]